MANYLIRQGDLIRLKSRTVFGWKGYGIALEDQPLGVTNPVIPFRRLDDDPDSVSLAMRAEIARCRVSPSDPPAHPNPSP